MIDQNLSVSLRVVQDTELTVLWYINKSRATVSFTLVQYTGKKFFKGNFLSDNCFEHKLTVLSVCRLNLKFSFQPLKCKQRHDLSFVYCFSFITR